MVTKPKASELSAAIRMNFAGPAKRDPEAAEPSHEKKRTTFTAPGPLLVELRMLALRHRCTMNELILLAIGDLFASLGHRYSVPVPPEVRNKVRNFTAAESGSSATKVINNDNSHLSPS